MAFQKAVRSQARARVAIDGPAKAGKSFTGLRLAFALAKGGGRVAAIDTEFGSLSKYAGASPDGEGPFDFDVLELRRFAPADYTGAIREAEQGGYAVLVIDSLSHAWVGEGGILDQADKSKKNNFAKWADLTPQQRKMVDAILGSPLHVIATMRAKMEYVLELDPVTKKQAPRKVGLGIVQRDGIEYEFDLLCSVDQEHLLTVSGSRCPDLDGLSAPKPGAGFFRPYVDWLRSGVAPAPKVAPPAACFTPAANGVAGNGPSAAPLTPVLAEMKRMRTALGIDAAGWAAILAKRGVTTARDLTGDQQAELVGRLRVKLDAAGATLQDAMAEAYHDGGAADGPPDKNIPY